MIMTTAEALASTRTVYCGPCTPRMSLREAFEKGLLLFQVCVWHGWCKPGEPSIRGSFDTVEEARNLAAAIPHAQVGAIRRGMNFPEEAII
jgi:hypothetical protein